MESGGFAGGSSRESCGDWLAFRARAFYVGAEAPTPEKAKSKSGGRAAQIGWKAAVLQEEARGKAAATGWRFAPGLFMSELKLRPPKRRKAKAAVGRLRSDGKRRFCRRKLAGKLRRLAGVSRQGFLCRS